MTRTQVEAIFLRIKEAGDIARDEALAGCVALRAEMRAAWLSIKPYVTGAWPYAE